MYKMSHKVKLPPSIYIVIVSAFVTNIIATYFIVSYLMNK